ncbi:Panacea domain-containing protein [Ferrimicrobium acidiphilum]|uniref:Panacea domain-containing protein n=1 Tax=Ferrimicrobium acidiphilum TaxID=121039 RepID=UPI0023F040C0|nr:type II toxin-antitoxin system antitoxin SocA domain-containing protein [Ferrimicrobium acidiphilum]
MPSVDDVASDVVLLTGQLPPNRLQRLLYYCQVWHLAWFGDTLFPEIIVANPSGPVIPSIRARIPRYTPLVASWPYGSKYRLTWKQHAMVSEIVYAYDAFDQFQLAMLCQHDGPWLAARRGLDASDTVGRIITVDLMYQCYCNYDQAV